MKKQSFLALAVSLVGSTALLGIMAFMLNTVPSISRADQAADADVITPTITALDPSSAYNDLDTSIVITGTDFVAVLTDTLVLTSPTAYLGNTTLMDVSWVNSTTLTATAPWGMNPGGYTLTVINPNGGTRSLTNAFTVTQGIGQWNGGNLFGGEVRQILMKPGDPNTLYAPAYGIVGLFRSQDAGEHWKYVSADVAINNGKFAIDPLHPDWLYGFAFNGLWRSQDEGDTWTTVMPNIWPDGRNIRFPQVYISPYDPQVLFVSSSESYGDPNANGAMGLIKSTDGGVLWQIVADMEGIPAQDVAFNPMHPLQMLLATSDARVFQSTDAGDTWNEVLKPPLSGLGARGMITYNPYRPSEVWIASMTPGGIYKSTDAAFTSWQDVTPADGMGSWDVKFTSEDSVYITRHHSEDGGLNWQVFGPFTSYGEMTFAPDNPQIGYIGDDTYGVQKTTDGGQTWEIKNQGLAGLRCNAMDISRANPLRVYATFGDGMGIYRSTDGATNWSYLPIAGSIHVGLVREDPFDSQRLYVEGGSFYVSTDGGESWSDLGWNMSPPVPNGMPWRMEIDPHQAGHLLVGMVYGNYGIGTGLLYHSSDYGMSWQAATMPQEVAWISGIAFDPETPGLVYISTSGTGVYRSTDGGMNWERIDDPQQPDMLYAGSIAIATHPQHMLLVGTSPNPYRSLDGGATWEMAQRLPSGGSDFMFAGGDSNRLYFGAGIGLFFSSDAGDSWTRAAGVLGQLQIMALGYADADGHTILYAATSGGSTVATSGLIADTPHGFLAAQSNLVEAGIYRYVQHTWQTFLPFVKR